MENRSDLITLKHNGFPQRSEKVKGTQKLGGLAINVIWMASRIHTYAIYDYVRDDVWMTTQ